MKFLGTTLLISFAFGLVFAPLASAQQVLVWATGNQDGNTQGVADYLTATGLFVSVTASDDPDLTYSDLDRYDAILFFTSFPTSSADLNAIGDLLADYADTGRRLVLAVFSWSTQLGNTLGGRIVSDAISPFVFEDASLYGDVTLVSTDSDPIWEGVSTLSGYFHDDVALVSGAVEHGTWSDGEPAAASKGNVFAINLFPDPVGGSIGGDYERLFANALFTYIVVDVDPKSWSSLKSQYE